MVTEDYVSFEVAKLLKERGFDEATHWFYKTITYLGTEANNVCIKSLNGIEDEPFNNSIFGFDLNGEDTGEYAMPTLQMVMKWLREVHHILLVVDYEYECDTTPYFFKMYRLGKNGKPERVTVKGVSYDKDNNATEHIVGYRDWERSKGDYSNYEQAAEAAIKYCLENLI